MKVRIICVGDELLVGDVTNTNATVLGDLITSSCLRVCGIDEVGDSIPELVDVLRFAVADADALVVTGGLGPTSDDLTREALAQLAGVPLCRDPGLLEALRRDYATGNRQLTDGALKQADLPQGARSLPNTRGTAPGIALQVDDTTVYAVPGVPHEMTAMVLASVLPELTRQAGSPSPRARRVLRTCGVGEGVIAERLAAVEKTLSAANDVRLAYLATPGETRVKLTSTTGGAAAVDAAARTARAALGDCVYAEGDTDLAEVVHRLLLERDGTLAAAESLTGGMVAAAMTTVPGVSATFRGSVTAYATDVKHAVLDVDAGLLAEHGAVHPTVAADMARGVRRLLRTSHAVATTGVAGPDSQDGHPVGTVYVAVDAPNGTEVLALRMSGDRTAIRTMTVVRALDLLRRVLLGLPPADRSECTG